MNIFTRFVVVAFTLLFSAQALANFLVEQASLVRVNKNKTSKNIHNNKREKKKKILKKN